MNSPGRLAAWGLRDCSGNRSRRSRSPPSCPSAATPSRTYRGRSVGPTTPLVTRACDKYLDADVVGPSTVRPNLEGGPPLRRRDRLVRHVRGEYLFLSGFTRERDDNRADECETEADHRDEDMPARPAETLVQEEDSDQDSDHGVRDRHRGNGRRGTTRSERHLLQHEPEHAGDCEGVALPVGEHRAHALVEVVERGL